MPTHARSRSRGLITAVDHILDRGEPMVSTLSGRNEPGPRQDLGAPLARCAVPGHFAQLGRPHGLPVLPELEIVLARSARSNRPPCDFLAEQMLTELRL